MMVPVSGLPYLLALAAATFFGAADFLGGLSARRTSTAAVVVVSGAAGLALLAVLLPVMPGSRPTADDLLWGAMAGLAGGAGIGLLYRALAIGRMAVVAPTSALCAVTMPVLAGIAMGERSSWGTGTGMVLALVAIVLVSRQAEVRTDAGAAADGPRVPPVARDGIGLGLLSGIAIGFFYLALARTSREAGLWPLLAARGASTLLFGAVAMARRDSLRMSAPVLRTVVAGGVLDMIANALYVLATWGGPLSVVVTLTSLYPASTVVLARFVLGERLSAWQRAGVACALIAVVLIVGAV